MMMIAEPEHYPKEDNGGIWAQILKEAQSDAWVQIVTSPSLKSESLNLKP